MPDQVASGARKGVSASPVVDDINAPAILAEIEAHEFVRLPELRPRIGMTIDAQKHVIREGLLEVAPGHRRQWEGYAITRDEACTLLLAAVLALAAGIATAAVLRGLKGAGLTGTVAAAAIRNMA